MLIHILYLLFLINARIISSDSYSLASFIFLIDMLELIFGWLSIYFIIEIIASVEYRN